MSKTSSEISKRVSQSLIGKFGEKSRRWKGEEAGYVAKHSWIIKHYGKANHCEKCHKENCSRYEWANISGKYKRDVNDYMQLCPSCHRKMDLKKEYCKHGHLYSEENTYINLRGHKQCKQCMKESQRRYKNAKKNKI
ncbi:MAG: hypothetical protein II393_00075 [Cytophagales bacterium]|nr:hypothetical protein [Cytophagales bacterium]